MIISVASGKGGTGKTAVAVSLALTAAGSGRDEVILLDCDVEEPNSGLFLDVEYTSKKDTGVPVPVVDLDRCTFCGKCGEVCAWNAIAAAGEKVLVFDDLCHGCGSCGLVCPEGAITEELHVTGLVEGGRAGNLAFARGVLNIGQAMPVPVISALLEEYIPEGFQGIAVIDSSPGTTCPVVEAVSMANYVLLVTEPTPFGLHDLKAAVDVVAGQMGKAAGVVINRDGIGDGSVESYCREAGLPVVARIPEDRRIAESLSEGIPIVQGVPSYRIVFEDLLDRILMEGRA